MFALGLALCPGLALAQAHVGAAIVDGKPVALYDDGTWEFVFKPKPGCQTLTKRISLCGEKGQWKRMRSDDPETLASFLSRGDFYVNMYLDESGLRDDVTMAFLREAVLENAAAGTGAMIEDIPVLGIEETEVDGRPGETLVYGVEFNGTPFVMANTIVLTADISLQAVVFNIGREYTDMHRAEVAAVLAGLRLGEDDAD
ncbi:hypothetical protein [Tropicibacter sp. S64]|uniref:hypothetical protein n=1 Tax=Tropicibacter sp. S64 TaxID=3415122 RepID=UPI003C7A2B0B